MPLRVGIMCNVLNVTHFVLLIEIKILSTLLLSLLENAGHLEMLKARMLKEKKNTS